MTKSTLSTPSNALGSRASGGRLGAKGRRRSPRTKKQNSDVLISAVISTYLLTHLHHVLQRAEYGAIQEGKTSQAENFAQLRKLLCMDARSMEDASAVGLHDGDLDRINESQIGSKAA